MPAAGPYREGWSWLTPEREAADTEEADRLEIERNGHTTYRRWSGWRKVMIAEGLRRAELIRQGQDRVPDHPLHRQHWDEYREGQEMGEWQRELPGTSAPPRALDFRERIIAPGFGQSPLVGRRREAL